MTSSRHLRPLDKAIDQYVGYYSEVGLELMFLLSRFKEYLQLPDFTNIEFDEELLKENDNYLLDKYDCYRSYLLDQIVKCLLADFVKSTKTTDKREKQLANFAKKYINDGFFDDYNEIDFHTLPTNVKLWLLLEIVKFHCHKEGAQNVDNFHSPSDLRVEEFGPCHDKHVLYYFHDCRLFKKYPASLFKNRPSNINPAFLDQAPWRSIYFNIHRGVHYECIANSEETWESVIENLANGRNNSDKKVAQELKKKFKTIFDEFKKIRNKYSNQKSYRAKLARQAEFAERGSAHRTSARLRQRHEATQVVESSMDPEEIRTVISDPRPGFSDSNNMSREARLLRREYQRYHESYADMTQKIAKEDVFAEKTKERDRKQENFERNFPEEGGINAMPNNQQDIERIPSPDSTTNVQVEESIASRKQMFPTINRNEETSRCIPMQQAARQALPQRQFPWQTAEPKNMDYRYGNVGPWFSRNAQNEFVPKTKPKEQRFPGLNIHHTRQPQPGSSSSPSTSPSSTSSTASRSLVKRGYVGNGNVPYMGHPKRGRTRASVSVDGDNVAKLPSFTQRANYNVPPPTTPPIDSETVTLVCRLMSREYEKYYNEWKIIHGIEHYPREYEYFLSILPEDDRNVSMAQWSHIKSTIFRMPMKLGGVEGMHIVDKSLPNKSEVEAVRVCRDNDNFVEKHSLIVDTGERQTTMGACSSCIRLMLDAESDVKIHVIEPSVNTGEQSVAPREQLPPSATLQVPNPHRMRRVDNENDDDMT